MSRQPEISAAYARLILQSGRVGARELLQGVSLTAQEIASLEFIGAADLCRLFRNFDNLQQDRAWTPVIGEQLNVASHGPLGFAALSAPTLGAALDVMGEMHACRNTALTSHTRADDQRYHLELFDNANNPELATWLYEIIAKIVELLLASILGHPVGSNVEIALTRKEPAHAAALAAQYDGSLRFAQAVNGVSVPLAWRKLPSPLHDESVYRVNLSKCRELIAAREHAGSVVYAMHSRLISHFDAQLLSDGEPLAPPTLETLAREMHMTPRTLLRRLQDEKTTYRTLVEGLRKDYAVRLLRDARLTVADVGEKLGYKEPANFGRAFRRWYGKPPAAWRREPSEEALD